jgi:hypothetical protein
MLIPLRASFNKNRLHYQQLLRFGDKVLYAVSSEKDVEHYECARIYASKNMFTKDIVESITRNSKFGTDGSRVFRKLKTATDYFTKWCES